MQPHAGTHPFLVRGQHPRASQDTRRVGKREESVPVPSLPLALSYCACFLPSPQGLQRNGTLSEQVMQLLPACLGHGSLHRREGDE